MNVRRSVAVAAAAVAVLSSCGFDVQTNQPYQPAVGVNDQESDVDVLNALVVVESVDSTEGTVVATLVNNNLDEPDDLVDVAGEGDSAAASVEVTGTTEIPANDVLDLSDEGGVTISGEDEIQAGRFVSITFTFEHAASVTVEAPIVEARGPYAEVPLP